MTRDETAGPTEPILPIPRTSGAARPPKPTTGAAQPSTASARVAVASATIRRADAGQIHVFEAILAALIVLGSIVAVQSLDVPSAPASGTLAQLKATGDDALRSLDLRPPGTAQSGYAYSNSTLVQYVATDNKAAMRAYLNASLPDNARYEVALRNATTREVWIGGRPPQSGEVVVSHRIVSFRDPPLSLGGTIIDVQLRIWFV